MIHSYPSQCGSWLSVTGMVASRVASSSPHFPSSISTLGYSRVGSVGINIYHPMSVLSTASGGLGVECIQPFLEGSCKLCLSSSCINSFSSVKVSGRTFQKSIETFNSSGTALDGGCLAYHSNQHVGRHSWALFCFKRSQCGCFSGPGDQGSAISAFNCLDAQRYVLYWQGFSFSVCKAVVWPSQASTT